MSSSNTVLLIGSDANLLDIRAMVLRHAGFEVRKAHHVSELEDAALKDGAHVLVLCHSLSSPDRQEALAVSEAFSPQSKVLVLTAQHANTLEDERVVELSTYEGPGRLVSVVQHMAASCMQAGS